MDADVPFICVAFCGTPDAVWFPNLVNEDQDGNPLTSSTAIESATNVAILHGPEESVFTCPVRPHNPGGN